MSKKNEIYKKTEIIFVKEKHLSNVIFAIVLLKNVSSIKLSQMLPPSNV